MTDEQVCASEARRRLTMAANNLNTAWIMVRSAAREACGVQGEGMQEYLLSLEDALHILDGLDARFTALAKNGGATLDDNARDRFLNRRRLES